ncbi:DUF1679 domain-containing protein [Thioclava sp. BHET1]|nr:DUF1679 domain-containing protein [Thioclava sp. BHET1]
MTDPPHTRGDAAQAFLATTDWAMAERRFLAGDASGRRYDRLVRASGETAVFMDAPPESGENVATFARIARHLLALGLSAPRILAGDEEAGFLLIEDLGDALFARLVAEDPAREVPLFTAATHVLVTLQANAPAAGLPVYDAPAMVAAIAPALDWYRFALTGEKIAAPDLAARLEEALMRDAAEAPVMIHRDYHSENLLWLPEREGHARVGLLDFQLAMISHPAVDLVSLCQDARRDAQPETEAAMIRHFCASTGQEEARFRRAYAVIGAQRHLRILGIFARLSLHFGKPHYTDFIPRVWRDLMRNLADPALAPLGAEVRRLLPPPTPEALERIRAQCGTIPTP